MLLRVRHGITWGTLSEGRSCSGGVCCQDFTSGKAEVHDRHWGREGSFRWDHPSELADTDALAARIQWGPRYPPLDGPTVQWVGYKLNDILRSYTFVPCSRPGCPLRLMVDLDSPGLKPGPADRVEISFGGGQAPLPPWWGTRQFQCGEGVTSSEPQPCNRIHGVAVTGWEQTSGGIWTFWDPEAKAILVRGLQGYGLVCPYRDCDFESPVAFADRIEWGALATLEHRLASITDQGDLLVGLRLLTMQPS